MDELDVFLANSLSGLRDRICISQERRDELSALSPASKHTKCGRRILATQVILILALCFLINLGAYASSRVLILLKDKVDETDMTDDEIGELYDSLKDEGYTDEEILSFEDLRVNENGQTYGIYSMGADLVRVGATNGKDGYCYREELDIGTGFSSPEEALEWQEQFEEKYPYGYYIPVYESDGETQIGWFKAR